MKTTKAVICPRCDPPMNRHAEKPDASDERRIVEIHTCPECGEIAAVHAALITNSEQW